jgi:hypothetical protein
MSKKRTYQELAACFAIENCKLLTTEKEFNELYQKYPKYKYIASCGHEHCVYFHVFLNRKTGVICPKCVIKRNIIKAKETISKDKLQQLKQELVGIDYLKLLLSNDFEIIKAFDGCKADVIIKPKFITTDYWLGLQIKSTRNSVREYSVHLNQDYTDCVVVVMYLTENNTANKMWAIPYENVANLKKISIGLYKSKYNQYEVTTETIVQNLLKAYNNCNNLKSFEELDTPINIYQQREQEYRKYRELTLNFIKFTDNGMEGLVYDFMIGNKKVQEKVSVFYKNGCLFRLHKSNGTQIINNKRNIIYVQYNKGDNNLYWLNCHNKQYFYVIPEQMLMNKGYIGNNDTKTFLKLNPTSRNLATNWSTPYLFDYTNVDKERLLQIIESS